MRNKRLKNAVIGLSIAAASAVPVAAATNAAEASFYDCPTSNGCLWVGSNYQAAPGFKKTVSSQGYSYNFKSFGNRRSQAFTIYNGNTKINCAPNNTGNYYSSTKTATRNVFSVGC